MKKLALATILLTSVFGCAGPTEYVPRGTDWKGGYEDTQLKQDLIIVGFRGNAVITWQQAQNYVLYRCAELTHKAGFDHFIITESMDSSGTFVVVTGSAGIATGTASKKPEITVKIHLGKGPAPSGNDNAFDALALLRSLDEKVPRDYTEHPHFR